MLESEHSFDPSLQQMPGQALTVVQHDLGDSVSHTEKNRVRDNIQSHMIVLLNTYSFPYFVTALSLTVI